MKKPIDFLKAQKRLLDKTYSKFLSAPEREFNNGKRIKGIFQKELDINKIPKSLVKKLVSLGLLKKVFIQMDNKSILVFYVVKTQ